MGKMTEQVNILVDKLKDLSSIPGTHMEGGKNDVLWSPYLCHGTITFKNQ